MTAEDRFVEKLRALLPASRSVLVGPGDDAAVLAVDGPLVATTDVLVEDVDFLPGEAAETLGRRAVAVNCSDLAAMGARPAWFLLAIAFPPARGEEFPLAIARAAAERAAELGASLVGGDLSRSATVMIAVALLGRAAARPLLRSGAAPGEDLFVTGFPGRAAAGLAIAKRGSGADSRNHSELLAAYRDPDPRVELGARLAEEGLASAAIDVSDGLGIDAGRLARASGVRLVIERERLPVARALADFAAESGADPLAWVLGGGDDYELLFTARADAEEALIRRPQRGSPPVTRIGRVEPGEGAFLEDRGETRDVSSLGYDHFEPTP